jgi:maleate cis-trans isomerase
MPRSLARFGVPVLVGASMLLAACSPQDMADKIGRRTAETVVRPIVDDRLAGPQVDAATRCVVQNASAAEVQTLARDVGVYAGTSTEATVWAIVARSETQSCLAAAGVALGA